jgi:antitoxin HicB
MPIWNTEFMRYAYPAIFSEEQDGVTVTFPDVPEAVTWGATRSEAREHAANALISALSTYVEENRPNPKPSPARGRDIVSVTALEATKLALHDAMLAACVSNRDLAGRLGLDEKAVRRLRDPLQRSAIGTVEAALRCLGKRVEVTVLDAA